MEFNPKTDVITYEPCGVKMIYIKPNGETFEYIPPKKMKEPEIRDLTGASFCIMNKLLKTIKH